MEAKDFKDLNFEVLIGSGLATAWAGEESHLQQDLHNSMKKKRCH